MTSRNTSIALRPVNNVLTWRHATAAAIDRCAGRNLPVSYIIFCPYKFLPHMRNSPHGTHYLRLRNIDHRGKFSPTKKCS
ncbi:hypothetical protein Y032_0105g3648 [Ancylostoma ceylanicum]|nr:hypothetical protein Y032_0105g3648 [Ancylostoma ceylanicum]